MLANFIICQACGCRGRAGNALSQNQSESPVFRYHGHDPSEGTMRYSCANCDAMLLVNPMDMLTTLCVRGVPLSRKETDATNPKIRAILQTGRILKIFPRRAGALKYH